jgi:Leucine-rich repeat (LRR) protein
MNYLAFVTSSLLIFGCLTCYDSNTAPEAIQPFMNSPVSTTVSDTCPNLSIVSLKQLKAADKNCVKEIDLNFKGQRFPPEILECQNLEKLLLMNCFDLSKIPAEISQLKKLKEIYIFASSIDSVPESLAELNHLRSLTISFSDLQEMPKNFCVYKEIRYVSFLGNFIRTVPECVFEMPTLEQLNIYIADDDTLTTAQRKVLQQLEAAKPKGFYFEY